MPSMSPAALTWLAAPAAAALLFAFLPASNVAADPLPLGVSPVCIAVTHSGGYCPIGCAGGDRLHVHAFRSTGAALYGVGPALSGSLECGHARVACTAPTDCSANGGPARGDDVLGACRVTGDASFAVCSTNETAWSNLGGAGRASLCYTINPAPSCAFVCHIGEYVTVGVGGLSGQGTAACGGVTATCSFTPDNTGTGGCSAQSPTRAARDEVGTCFGGGPGTITGCTTTGCSNAADPFKPSSFFSCDP